MADQSALITGVEPAPPESPDPTPSGAPITVRVLPPDEWPRLLDPAVESPFRQYGLPPAGTWRIIVAEQEGRIVGLSCIYPAFHWDGLWFAPEARRATGAMRQMIRIGKAELEDLGAPGAFALIEITSTPGYRAMIERLGFERADGDLYLLDLQRLPKGV